MLVYVHRHYDVAALQRMMRACMHAIALWAAEAETHCYTVGVEFTVGFVFSTVDGLVGRRRAAAQSTACEACGGAGSAEVCSRSGLAKARAACWMSDLLAMHCTCLPSA